MASQVTVHPAILLGLMVERRIRRFPSLTLQALIEGQIHFEILSSPASTAVAPVVLDNLADGESIEGLLRSYPSITREGIMATLAYAAELA